ncbi:heme-binding protein [Paracoccaceae bacterium]|jgi:effector-binding domain-containing protein|nr:heme-binding protein [Paracoccaceae bacterium]
MRVSLVLLVSFFCLWANISVALEETSYRVLAANQIYEIREYDDRIAVQTTQKNGQNGAFRKLFKYISGSNISSAKIEMTTPVIQSVKIDMTTPVTQKFRDGEMIMQFFLPRKFQLKTAPQPLGENLSIVVVKGGKYAVIKYSGRSTYNNFEKHSKLLLEALFSDNIKIVNNPIKATFNGPLTPFFLRRNEAMIRIK